MYDVSQMQTEQNPKAFLVQWYSDKYPHRFIPTFVFWGNKTFFYQPTKCLLLDAKQISVGQILFGLGAKSFFLAWNYNTRFYLTQLFYDFTLFGDIDRNKR